MFNFDMDGKKYQKIHFIGIGGVSMSGLAELMNFMGYEVTGSDKAASKHTRRLQKMGISIEIGQKAGNIKDQDLFVYTDAIPADNEELLAARKTGKEVISRGEFLGAVMQNYDKSIAVSGSHGKSTTTSMLSNILLHAEDDPTILIGGLYDEIQGNAQLGHSDYFLAEACEYKDNIRFYYPRIAIVLNIDLDHTDCYPDLNAIIQAFEVYMDHLSDRSIAVINGDDPHCQSLLSHVRGEAYRFGIKGEDLDFQAHHIEYSQHGHPSFDVRYPDGTEEHYKLAILGEFNIYNALAAIAASYAAGIDRQAVKKGLEGYHNLHRRMEMVGQFKGADVMTDYGHHPIEIRNTLDALKNHQHRRLYCVFQPHTYSRTKYFMDDYARSFDLADEVLVTDIFNNREPFDPTVHPQDLVEKINEHGTKARYRGTFQECIDYLEKVVEAGDLILTTGCGNPDELAYELVEEG